ncbi:RidA family protein [Nesterenkonia pannonica]|uniref:RidA family protein n=1 Tax=Nesterenkonia pannonica TaxID=1548602 RepID=UPI00216460D5|nr:RidA family protein [Nesterenkonia pannonica]
MTLTHLNPASLHTNPAFSQGVLVTGGSLLVVGGQNGTDKEGQLVSSDLGDQTKQALRNVLAVLAEAGADASHVARLGVYLAAGADAGVSYASAFDIWGANPAAVTVLTVHSFARPGVLVEIEALALVPETL